LPQFVFRLAKLANIFHHWWISRLFFDYDFDGSPNYASMFSDQKKPWFDKKFTCYFSNRLGRFLLRWIKRKENRFTSRSCQGRSNWWLCFRCWF
jgi:hypothetical protein